MLPISNEDFFIPFMPNKISAPYQNWTNPFRICWIVVNNFIQILKVHSVRNIAEPDQYAASDLALHCLPTSHKIDARLIKVKK